MFINKFLLSEPELYIELRQQLTDVFSGKSINKKNIQRIAYASWNRKNYYSPDNVFFNHWNNLEKRVIEEKGSISRALLSQVARYHIEENPHRLAVKFDRFDEWQKWIANQSGLPVIAYQIEKNMILSDNAFERLDQIKALLGFRTLISPYHAIVEDYIDCEGLHETHMHLNGTTAVEVLWHYSLQHSEQIVRDMQKEFSNNERVRLLYAVTTELNTPEKYRDLLLLARYLRQYFIIYLNNDIEKQKEFESKIYSFLTFPIDYTDNRSTIFTDENNYYGDELYHFHNHEVRLHISILESLKSTNNPILDIGYLLYILCMNCFQRVLVQRDDQYGFNQFQKLADGGAREAFEKHYDARFHQLHGPNMFGKSDLSTLEGRFAPKNTQEKNIELLTSILRGYLLYIDGNGSAFNESTINELALRIKIIESSRPTFRLIAHFIKTKWEPCNDFLKEDFHFKGLREVLYQNGQLLLELMEDNPALKSILTGVDAAANELEAPPEVFSFLFAYCRRHGISHFTYHVGEDFEHLLNGIRAVFEAIAFLDLKSGDRLGHATAIGIDPYLWINQVSDAVFLPQGQWLENLLFLRHVMLEGYDIKLSLARIESEIFKTAYRIFGEEISLTTLQIFYENRDIPPEIARDFKEDNYSSEMKFFLKKLEHITNNYPKSFDLLLKRWFNTETIKEYDQEFGEYQISFIPSETLLIAQQFVQEIVANKQIILETLPTSNVRISHYKSVKEHHIFRWLQVPVRIFEGDHEMLITLGSDDTGIFVTDMRNEFYHLFTTLINEFNYSAHDALRMVGNLNENGRVYRFDE